MLPAEAWAFGPERRPDGSFGGARRGAFRASALVLCALAGVMLLGLSSLVYGWVQGGAEMMHRVHDIGWGTFTVILLCAPAVAQLRDPEQRTASMQQIVVCLAAGGLSMTASGAFGIPHLLRGLVLAAPAALMLALHPARAHVLRPRLRALSPVLLAFAAVAAVPLFAFATEQIRIQRLDTVSPHGVAFHWGTMATLASSIVATMLVAAFRAPGWRSPAWCAGLALGISGVAAALYPTYASSVGRSRGALIVVFAVAYIAVAERQLAISRRRIRNEADGAVEDAYLSEARAA